MPTSSSEMFGPGWCGTAAATPWDRIGAMRRRFDDERHRADSGIPSGGWTTGIYASSRISPFLPGQSETVVPVGHSPSVPLSILSQGDNIALQYHHLLPPWLSAVTPGAGELLGCRRKRRAGWIRWRRFRQWRLTIGNGNAGFDLRWRWWQCECQPTAGLQQILLRRHR
jgi:hypothetical protein